jgi:sugar phosphate isomerase/epimerase
MTDHELKSLSRREALAIGLGAAGLLAIGGKPAQADSPAEKKIGMKIGCSTVNFRKIPLKDALQRIRRAGFEYTETHATGPWCPHVTLDKDDPQAFQRLVTEHGFKGVTGLWALNGSIIGHPQAVEGIAKTIRWAKEAGIPVVHAGDGWKPETMSQDDAFKLLRDRLAKILEVAEQCQVYLAIEPHGTFSLTPAGLNKIMGISDSKWLGINYDTANVHRATIAKGAPGAYPSVLYGQPQDEVSTLKAVAGRVVHTHIKDVAGADCVPLGEGTVNIVGCVRFLRQFGYSGILSLETEGDLETEQNQHLIELGRAYLRGALT